MTPNDATRVASARPLQALNPGRYAQYLQQGREPWHVVSLLHAALPDVALEVVVSGLSLVGREPVADDVVELFVRQSAASGVQVLRVMDPLNDLRNVEVALGAAKRAGLQTVAVLCFAEGPPYTSEWWRDRAQQARELGANRIVILESDGDVDAPGERARELSSGIGEPVAVVSVDLDLSGVFSHAEEALGRELDDSLLRDLFAEIRAVQADLGWPPLTWPVAGIIADQAVRNLASGDRYRDPCHELKQYLHGSYGRPAGEVSAELRRLVIGQDEAIAVRPGELLAPQVEKARSELERMGAETSDSNVLNLVLFPELARRMLQSQRHLATEPEAEEAVADEQRAEGAAASSDGSGPAADAAAPAPAAAPASAPTLVGGDFDVEVEGEVFRVRVSPTGGGVVTTAAAGAAPSPASAPSAGAPEGTAVVAPMQGLLVKINVKAGDEVKLGDVVAVLEAMKMQNDIVSTAAGRVSSVAAKQGEVVTPNQPLVYIA